MEKSEFAASIDKDIFLKCYDLIWSKMAILSSVQAGTFAGWYFLLKENEKLIAAFLLSLSLLIIYIIYLSIRRLTFIQERHRLALLEAGCLSQPKKMPSFSVSEDTFFFQVFKTQPFGHRLAKSAPLLLMIFNYLLLAFTLQSMLPKETLSSLAIAILILVSLSLAAWIFLDFKNIINS